MNDTKSSQQPGMYRAVRIGDVADWRLLAYVSSHGIGAWLRNSDPVHPLVPMLERKWSAKEENLLSNIENAVYDHPQVLDDFSSDIVVSSPRTIIVPTKLVADDDDEALRLYNQIYSAEESDLMTDTAGEATMLFSLTPGLHGFLQRTFPGARIHSHLALLADRLRDRSSDMPRLYVDIRCPHDGEEQADAGEVDFVAFDRQNLLMAVTHRWNHPNDIRYHIFNIMQVFGLDTSITQVSVSGPARIKTPLVQELRRDVAYVVMTAVPNTGANIDVPLPVALLLRR